MNPITLFEKWGRAYYSASPLSDTINFGVTNCEQRGADLFLAGPLQHQLFDGFEFFSSDDRGALVVLMVSKINLSPFPTTERRLS